MNTSPYKIATPVVVVAMLGITILASFATTPLAMYGTWVENKCVCGQDRITDRSNIYHDCWRCGRRTYFPAYQPSTP